MFGGGKNTNQRPEGQIRDQTHRIRDQAQNQRPDRQKPRPDSRITPLRIRDQTGPNQRPDRVASETKGTSRESKGFIVVTTGLTEVASHGFSHFRI